ncbi:hypothetical protein BJ944DRAFT_274345 [Cunninghamella echinulata]|nr:hypothetical protein BJ944DRAFT_274345 [Cunninghamella echinulata]
MISNTIYTKPTQSTFMDHPQQLKNNNNNIYKSKHHYSPHNNQYKTKQQQHVTDPFAGMKEYVDYQQKIEQLKAIMIPTTKSSSSLSSSSTKKYSSSSSSSSSSSIHKQSYDSIDCSSSITSMDTSNSSHSDHTLNECLTPRSLSPTSDHHQDYYHTSEHPSSSLQQQQLFKRNDISDDEKIRFIHFIQRRSGWSRTFVNKSFLEQDHSLWSTNQYQQQPTTTATSYYRLF